MWSPIPLCGGRPASVSPGRGRRGRHPEVSLAVEAEGGGRHGRGGFRPGRGETQERVEATVERHLKGRIYGRLVTLITNAGMADTSKYLSNYPYIVLELR